METGSNPKKVKTKSQKLCRHFKKGFCKNKERCRYSHKVENCEDWIQEEGSCINKHCQKRHIPTCIYNNIGKCRFGPKCHYIHKTTKQNDLKKELELLKEENISLKQALKDLAEEVRDIKVNVCKLKEKEVEIVEDTGTENMDMEAAKEEIQVFVEDKVVVHVEKCLRCSKKTPNY